MTDPERETARAARVTGVIYPVRHAALLEARGPDTARYLEAMCTKDLSGLDPGGLRYTVLLDDRARVVADFWIWRVGESWWLEVDSSIADTLRDRLNRFAVADDVEVVRRPEFELVQVEGPRAGEVASAVLREDLRPDAAGPAMRPFILGWARRSRFGEPGFTLACTGSPLALFKAGEADGLGLASQAVQESLRLEAGRVRFGVDFGEGDLLPEVGLWGAVSLDKGCFPGQEIVRRIVSRGEVKRRLVGFVEDTAKASPNAPALHVTSIADSASLGKRIGLGWVAAIEARPGVRATVQEPLFGARVAALPFVSGPHAAAPDVPGERVENTASR